MPRFRTLLVEERVLCPPQSGLARQCLIKARQELAGIAGALSLALIRGFAGHQSGAVRLTTMKYWAGKCRVAADCIDMAHDAMVEKLKADGEEQ